MDQQRTMVHEFAVGEHDFVRSSLRQVLGHRVVDVRMWSEAPEAPDGPLQPSSNGLELPTNHLPELLEAVQVLVAAAMVSQALGEKWRNQ